MTNLPEPNTPAWATETVCPDPGTYEYVRLVGNVICQDRRDELIVRLVQRDSEPVEVSLAGLRLSSDAVDVLIRLLKSAVHVIQHGSEEDPGGLVLMA